jgi:hypothetical protein
MRTNAQIRESVSFNKAGPDGVKSKHFHPDS